MEGLERKGNYGEKRSSVLEEGERWKINIGSACKHEKGRGYTVPRSGTSTLVHKRPITGKWVSASDVVDPRGGDRYMVPGYGTYTYILILMLRLGTSRATSSDLLGIHLGMDDMAGFHRSDRPAPAATYRGLGKFLCSKSKAPRLFGEKERGIWGRNTGKAADAASNVAECSHNHTGTSGLSRSRNVFRRPQLLLTCPGRNAAKKLEPRLQLGGIPPECSTPQIRRGLWINQTSDVRSTLATGHLSCSCSSTLR